METDQTNITPPQPTLNVQQPVSNPVQNPIPIQPQTFPASEQPRGSKWRLILIVLLILSIFSFGGYYLVLPKMGINILPTPTPTPTITKLPSPTPDPTANWKTYTNKVYGYSLKYPLDWGFQDDSQGNVNLLSKPEYIQMRKQQGQLFNKDDYAEVSFSIYKKGVTYTVGIITDDTDIKTFVKKSFGLDYLSITDMTLDVQPAVTFVSQRMVLRKGLPQGMQNCPPELQPCTIPDGVTKQVWTKINGDLLYIVYSYGNNYKDISNLQTTFDQILSTFKFLSPSPTSVQNQTIDTSSWKTYNLSDAQFKYPSQWQIINEHTFINGNEKFIMKCPGPILQNTQKITTFIAVESIDIKKQSDGSFCWSGGSFKDDHKRIITTATSSKQISVSRWAPNNSLGQFDKELDSPSWQGYLFQTFSFNDFSKENSNKLWYEFSLIYENGQDNTAEQTFDKILSTFQFINP